MCGPDQVIVVKKQTEFPLHRPQAQVGGTRAPQWQTGRATARFVGHTRLPDDTQGKPLCGMCGPRVHAADGINDNDFNVRVGLRGHAGDGIDQRRPVHTTD